MPSDAVCKSLICSSIHKQRLGKIKMRFIQYSISEEIKRSLAESGFVKPTDIQFKAIPSIMKGEDVLAIAQTGTGKTAAFAIPIVNRPLYVNSYLFILLKKNVLQVFRWVG